MLLRLWIVYILSFFHRYMTSFGFILLRNIRCDKSNCFWQESLACIRRVYPYHKVLIIDDNSNYDFVTPVQVQDPNVILIDSEYKGRGEILPYIYFLRYAHLFEKAVFIHDTAYIRHPIDDLVARSDNIPLWDFANHHWDNVEAEKGLIARLNNCQPLLYFYDQKHLWNGFYGGMSIMSRDFLQRVDSKYGLANLLDFVTCRDERHHLERVLSIIFTYEMNNCGGAVSVFGDIHRYCKWGYSFEEYLEDRDKLTLPIVKVWAWR